MNKDIFSIGMTFQRFMIEKQKMFPEANGDFSSLLSAIMFACKKINKEVERIGLTRISNLTGKTNIQGEDVQKIDELANELFYCNLMYTKLTCVMASEEDDQIIVVPKEFALGDYVVEFDPFDGSSNSDVNVNVGSIFAIYKRISKSGCPGTLEDCLQAGRKQVAAGYVLYGPSAMLVFTTGNGVNGFTLEKTLGEFILSHPNIQIPKKGKIYSINDSNSPNWEEGIKEFIEHLKNDGANRSYTARYIGSLVADFHRNLLKGGIFLYPGDNKNPNGKLRLLYEANPLAFIVKQAGGLATTGKENILDIVPQELHQRVPLIIGSQDDVEMFLKFYKPKLV